MKAEQLISGFDPDNDAWDRRILYEVTGITLRSDEFAEFNSSRLSHGDTSESELSSRVSLNHDSFESARFGYSFKYHENEGN